MDRICLSSPGGGASQTAPHMVLRARRCDGAHALLCELCGALMGDGGTRVWLCVWCTPHAWRVAHFDTRACAGKHTMGAPLFRVTAMGMCHGPVLDDCRLPLWATATMPGPVCRAYTPSPNSCTIPVSGGNDITIGKLVAQNLRWAHWPGRHHNGWETVCGCKGT